MPSDRKVNRSRNRSLITTVSAEKLSQHTEWSIIERIKILFPFFKLYYPVSGSILVNTPPSLLKLYLH